MQMANPAMPGAYPFRAKDPVSALTHFIALVTAILCTPPMLIYAANQGLPLSQQIGLGIFQLSLILLYGASSAYHTFFSTPRANRRLKKFDHMMIFVLIAGTYTPFCMMVLDGASGRRLLCLIWGIGLAGMLFKAFWVTCPKWVSSVLYIAMGWVCVMWLPEIISKVSPVVFFWLLLGGIVYTVGGVIYALKMPVFNGRFRQFGSHELFHLFVMAGSACHAIMLLCCIAAL